MPLDGYQALADVLRMPRLREEATAYFTRGIWRDLRAGRRPGLRQLGLAAYGFTAIVGMTLFVLIAFWRGTRASATWCRPTCDRRWTRSSSPRSSAWRCSRSGIASCAPSWCARSDALPAEPPRPARRHRWRWRHEYRHRVDGARLHRGPRAGSRWIRPGGPGTHDATGTPVAIKYLDDELRTDETLPARVPRRGAGCSPRSTRPTWPASTSTSRPPPARRS